MGGTRRGPLRYVVLVAVLVGIVTAPYLYLQVLKWVAPLFPRPVVESVCFGFLCAVPLLLLGFLVVLLPTFWVVAELYERGYLPEGW